MFPLRHTVLRCRWRGRKLSQEQCEDIGPTRSRRENKGVRTEREVPDGAARLCELWWHGRVGLRGTSLSPVAIPYRGVRVPCARAQKGALHAAGGSYHRNDARTSARCREISGGRRASRSPRDFSHPMGFSACGFYGLPSSFGFPPSRLHQNTKQA